MKSIGVVRKIDELGRIVLPSELRESLDMKSRDSVEIFTDGERIVLQKYQPCCIFCDNADDLTIFNNKKICRECLEKLKAQP